MGKLVFHIGDPKTGSTSIQNALDRGDITTPSLSLTYPKRNGSLNHNYLVNLFKSEIEEKGRNRGIRQLVKQIRGSRWDVCVISAELFDNFGAKRFRKVIDQCFRDVADEIQVIAYVRPHASRILSSFAEQVKIGAFYGNLNEFVELAARRKRFFYAPRFASWREQFGDAFVLRPFVRDRLYMQSVVHDLMQLALGSASFEVRESSQANESVTLEQTVLIMLLQQRIRGAPKNLRHALGWEVASLFGTYPPSGNATRLKLHKDAAARIRESFLEDAELLDNAFFPESPLMAHELDQALDSAIDGAQSLDPLDHFTGRELSNLQVMADLLVEMLAKEDNEPWSKYLHGLRIDRVRSSS